MEKKVDDLPITLKVTDISSVLGISIGNAYNLCHSRNFPSVKIGRRIVVPKLAFIRWLENPNAFNERRRA